MDVRKTTGADMAQVVLLPEVSSGAESAKRSISPPIADTPNLVLGEVGGIIECVEGGLQEFELAINLLLLLQQCGTRFGTGVRNGRIIRGIGHLQAVMWSMMGARAAAILWL